MEIPAALISATIAEIPVVSLCFYAVRKALKRSNLTFR
mgnify:CR=1 FL=1